MVLADPLPRAARTAAILTGVLATVAALSACGSERQRPRPPSNSGSDARVDSGEPPADSGIDGDAAVIEDGGDDPDTGEADAGTPDAGQLDAAEPDAGEQNGCGRSANPGAHNREITVNGTRRTFIVVVPDGYDPNTPIPLIFGWHGNGWNANSFRPSVAVEASADRPAIFVYADGLPVGGGASGWDLSNSGRDVRLFDALVTQLRRELCIEETRIFSYGRSYGAFFTNTLACARPNVLRASAAISGGGPGGGCVGPTSAWVSHNMDDGTVGFQNGVNTRNYFVNANQCDPNDVTQIVPDTCVEYNGCMPRSRVVWCAQPTGGHNPPNFAGASIWAFFSGF